MRIISGKFKNRSILTPKGSVTRPTAEKLRGALFNICQHYIEGTEFLDLFAGSGAMGIEALSRGAAQATFIDSDRESMRCIKQNIENLNIKNESSVLQGDVFLMMEKLIKQKKQFDIIFADPPYDHFTVYHGEKISFSERIVKMVNESSLLKESGILFIEESADSQPLMDNSTLQLISRREMGRSSLQEYKKIS
jgi:16S rRNA (guanine966-N2)-methyltransferase